MIVAFSFLFDCKKILVISTIFCSFKKNCAMVCSVIHFVGSDSKYFLFIIPVNIYITHSYNHETISTYQELGIGEHMHAQLS